MNNRAIVYQVVIFSVQWLLMLFGFFLLSTYVAVGSVTGLGGLFGQYLDSGLKAVFAVILSVVWLLIWDRQVRAFFYRKR